VDVGTVVALKYASEKLFDWMIGPSPARKYGIKFGKKIKPPKTDVSIKTLSIVDEVEEEAAENADKAVEGIWEGNNKSIKTLSKVEEEKTVEGNKNVSFCQSLCLFEDYTPDFITASTIPKKKILGRNLNYYNAMLKK